MKQIIYSLFLVCLLVSAKSDKKPFNEKYRPQFHFSPEKNWLFEPSGFAFYKGEYHLFYHNVSINDKIYSDQIGHSVSKDLIHWQHLPFAFTPEEKAPNLLSAPPTSGSTIVDSLNISGLQSKTEKPMLIYYSDSIGNQNLAVSQDKGMTWSIYANNRIFHIREGMRVIQ